MATDASALSSGQVAMLLEGGAGAKVAAIADLSLLERNTTTPLGTGVPFSG